MTSKDYEDIINLPHPEPKNHIRMSKEARSAQFAPFSALTGYSDAIKETSRLTTKKIEIDDSQKLVLNNKLKLIIDNIEARPKITFTYFINDNKKSGGKYIKITGNVKKIDTIKGIVILLDKAFIPINNIIDIKGDLFNNYEE